MSPPLFRRALLTLSTPTCGTNLDVLLELVTTSVTLVSDELRVAIRCPGITDFAARPVLLFKGVQNLLGQLYVAASAKAVEVDRLLMSVDIIVEGVCGYDPWAEWDEADALIVGKQGGPVIGLCSSALYRLNYGNVDIW